MHFYQVYLVKLHVYVGKWRAQSTSYREYSITGYGKNVYRVVVKLAHNVLDMFIYKVFVLAKLTYEV